MSNRVTVELPQQVVAWLETAVKQTGLSPQELIQKELLDSVARKTDKPYMALAGTITGLPSNLSERKGFDRG